MSSLRRVSSRQRLVSWDAFDATIYYDSTEEEDYEENVPGPDASYNNNSATTNIDSGSTHLIPAYIHPHTSSPFSTNTVPAPTIISGNSDVDTLVDTNEEDEEEEEDYSLDFKRKRRHWYPSSTTRMTVTPRQHVAAHDVVRNDTTTTITTPPPPFPHDVIPTPLVPTSHPNDGTGHVTSSRTCIGVTATSSTEATLLQLPLEIQCIIYQYLNCHDLRHITQLCTDLRQSMLRTTTTSLQKHYATDHANDEFEEAQTEANDSIVESALWKPMFIHQYWPFLKPFGHLPFITSITSETHVGNNNYPLLLSMSRSNIPTHIDTTLFPYALHILRRISSGNSLFLTDEFTAFQGSVINSPAVVRPISRVRQPKLISMNCTITTTITNNNSKRTSRHVVAIPYGQKDNQQQVIQFIGKVGFGDQCIRSNAPLPRPKRIIAYSSTTKWSFPIRSPTLDPFTTTSATSSTTFLQRVFRNAIHSPTTTGTVPTDTMMRRSSNAETTTTNTGDNQNTTISLFCPLRRSMRIAARQGSSMSGNSSHTSTTFTVRNRTRIPYRPFCAPFITPTNEINITPRYIAYYEVTILPLPTPPSAESMNGQTNDLVTMTKTSFTHEGNTTTVSKRIQYPPDHPYTETTTSTTTNNRHSSTTLAVNPFGIHNNNATSSVSDCVAVGIGTEQFPLSHRMPGWDYHSYGYHGDDGGIFHGNGSMIQPYNRPFGTNDTIGCGIDYLQNSIFFTLNGIFLGYAFTLLPKHRNIDLYPIIGMDTQYPILCNFTGPFVFDLPKMMQQHDPILQEQLPL